MKTLHRGLLGFTLLCSIGFGGTASAGEASEAMAQGFIASLDATAAWDAKAAQVKSEGTATVISGLVVTETSGKGTLNVAEMRFDNLQALGDGGFSTSLLTVRGTKTRNGPFTFDIPALTVENFSTPGFGGWSLDTKAPMTSLATLYTRLAKSEFSLLRVPAMSYVQKLGMVAAAGEAESAGTYKELRYENLKGGRLSALSFGGMDSTTSGPGGEVKLVWEGASARNIDFAGMARVMDPASYAGGKGDLNWIRVVDSGSYGKLTVSTAGKAAATMEGIDFGSMDVRQTEKPFAAGLDALIMLGPNPPPAQTFKLFREYGSSLAGWFRLGSMTMNGFKAFPPEGGEIGIGRVGLEDVSADGMKRFHMDRLSAAVPTPEGQAGGSIELIEVADVVWPSMAAFGTLAEFGDAKERGAPIPPELLSAVAESFLAIYPHIGRIAIGKTVITIPKSDPITMEGYLHTSTGPYAGPLAAKSEQTLSKFVIPGSLLRLDPSSAQIFDMLGYQDLVTTITGGSTYDAAAGAVSGTTAWTVVEAGRLSMEFSLGGLTAERLKALVVPLLNTPEGGEPDVGQLIVAANGVTYNGFALRFDDTSLTKRLIKLAAAMQNMDESTVTSSAIAMTQLGLSQLKHPAFTKDVVAALTAFLAEPRSLAIVVTPAAPLSLPQMMLLDPNQPGQIIDLFGVKVTANQ